MGEGVQIGPVLTAEVAATVPVAGALWAETGGPEAGAVCIAVGAEAVTLGPDDAAGVATSAPEAGAPATPGAGAPWAATRVPGACAPATP